MRYANHLSAALSVSAALATLALLPNAALAQKAHSHARISASQARAAALKESPGKVVGKVPLENEDGKWQYAVTIRSGKTLREVMVNSNTGKIANVEVTTKEEEEKEAREDAAKAKGHGRRSGTGHGKGTAK